MANPIVRISHRSAEWNHKDRRPVLQIRKEQSQEPNDSKEGYYFCGD